MQGTLQLVEDAPETLPRRLRDALGRHGVSGEGPGNDFLRFWGSRGVSGDRFPIDFRDDFSFDFASESASERHNSRRFGAVTDARCKAKQLDGEIATDIADRSSLFDVSERARNRNTHT